MPALPIRTVWCAALAGCALGCSGAPEALTDGGPDGSVDLAVLVDLAMREPDASPDLAMLDPELLCTTGPCAASPCGPGCVFGERMGSCSGQLSASVPAATVKACRGFCGLFAETPWGFAGLGCGTYHDDWPGCEVCGFRWGAPSCVEQTQSADYQHGGVICAATCFDGRPPSDMDPGCSNHDMFPQRWDLSH